MKPRVVPEASFLKRLAGLPPDRRESAKQALVKFQKEPALNSLKFRRLQGTPDHFIINSVGGDRILLRKDGPDLYAAVDVGTHDLYRRWDR
jgi:hypothetical protein